MKNKFKVAVAIISLGITGIASAANTCPVKVTQSNNEVSQHIKAIINGEHGNSNNSVEVKHIDLPDITVGDSGIDQFTGGFSVTPDSDLVAKAIVQPNLKNVSNLLLYRKTLAYASKLNLGQLRAYAQGILDYQAQNPSDTTESEALASFAHGVIDYYNIFFKVTLDKPLTANEKVIISKSNYPIAAMASQLSKRLTDKADYLKNKSELTQADQLMFDQTMDERTIQQDQVILKNSIPFAISLALKTYAPDVYTVLNDVKTHAYQKVQLSVLLSLQDNLNKILSQDKMAESYNSSDKLVEIWQRFKKACVTPDIEARLKYTSADLEKAIEDGEVFTFLKRYTTNGFERVYIKNGNPFALDGDRDYLMCRSALNYIEKLYQKSI